MIYKGAHERSTEVLSSYLPGGQGSSNVFENGGALFALGLINQGNRSPDIIQRLTDAVRNPQLAKSEQVIHGACLGLGLVTFASEDAKTTDLLRELLFKNESIYGEAAALGIGLTHAGSGSLELAKELLQFSRSSDKDKIIR
jgi:26S proteasome regulatory subunit N2